MKKLAILIAVAAVFVLGVGVSVALADKPPSPPGQGPCEHGNSQKPCRDDPQPDHGADCEEHGPKEGGVNEDHCKGETTPTETEPTETTPTETTPTETTPTTPEETTPSTPTETTPPETPDGGPSTPEPPVTETDTTTTSVTPGPAPTSVESLEDELKEQAAQNGATNAPSSHVVSAEELPYTGVSLWWAVALGTGLVGTGLYARGDLQRLLRRCRAGRTLA